MMHLQRRRLGEFTDLVLRTGTGNLIGMGVSPLLGPASAAPCVAVNPRVKPHWNERQAGDTAVAPR